MKCPKKNIPFSFSLRRSWARQGVPPSSGATRHLPPGEGFFDEVHRILNVAVEIKERHLLYIEEIDVIVVKFSMI